MKGGGKSSLRRTYGRGDDGDDAVDAPTAYSWREVPDKGASKGGLGQKRAYQKPAWKDDAEDDNNGNGNGGWRSRNSSWKKRGDDRDTGNRGGGNDDGGWSKPHSAFGNDWQSQGKRWHSYKEAKPECKYEGVLEATTLIVAEIAHLETKQDPENLIQYFVNKVEQAADDLAKDERLATKGGQLLAVSLIEELVEAVMHPLSQRDSEKEWYMQVDVAAPLKAAAMAIFQNSKLFSRMLAPMMDRYVEESVFRFREDERFQVVLWEIVEKAEMQDHKYCKKTYQYLQKAYEDAHTQTEFGETKADEPALGVVQDFVKSWISLFVGRAWDVLENGVGGGVAAQAAWVTKLFQSLLHPDRCCLSYDLVSSLANPLPAEWDFINDVACNILAEAHTEQPSKKKTKTNYNKDTGATTHANIASWAASGGW